MAKNDVWKTKDGQHIKMSDMSDRHLTNALNCFKPKNKFDAKTTRWKLLKNEAKRRKWKVTDKEGLVPPDEPIGSRFEILDI